jgi:hypothetical protein
MTILKEQKKQYSYIRRPPSQPSPMGEGVCINISPVGEIRKGVEIF